MRLRALALMMGWLLVATPAWAASADGTWNGAVDTPDGAVDVSFTFKTAGAELTGTTTGPDGSSMALKNGKVDGDKISFAVDFDFGGGPMTVNYTGVVKDAQIALTIDFMGMPLETVLKKAN
ncbi:MAG: hypothetical protein FJW23_03545 [Acidimicrobiia bacterium]|nr:hypothetical protein [Acidimicrobiia bacterium]